MLPGTQRDDLSRSSNFDAEELPERGSVPVWGTWMPHFGRPGTEPQAVVVGVDDHGLAEEPVRDDEPQLRRSAEDDETLLSVVASPEVDLPTSDAGAKRPWAAVTATRGHEPDFVVLSRMTTSRPLCRQR